MRGRKLRTWLVMALAAAVGGCQFADELLWPNSPPEGICSNARQTWIWKLLPEIHSDNPRAARAASPEKTRASRA